MSKSKGREQCPCSDDDVMSRGIITCDNNEDDDEFDIEEENEETLTKEEAMEMVHRKRSNRLH